MADKFYPLKSTRCNNKQSFPFTVFFVLLLISFGSSGFAQTDTWVQKADFGGSVRTAAAGFSIGKKGYIGTGQDANYFLTKDFWEYDPATDTWAQKADFGGAARLYAVGFSIGNKGYIGTGDGYAIFKDFWEYDPATNTWTQKADFGGYARYAAVGFNIDNKGYIGTGEGDHYKRFKDFWEYDPATDTWIQKADFGGATRLDAAGFSIGSKGYIGTGDYDIYNAYKDFWEYDPATNKWTKKADFAGSARYAAVGLSIGGKGYIGVGFESFPPIVTKDFWEYDPAGNVWIQKADYGGEPTNVSVGFSIDNNGYMGMGNERDFWEYTPDTLTKCPTPYNLRVIKIADTCARLNWSIPGFTVEHIKVSYRPVGTTTWIEDRKKEGENNKWICGLIPNTSYDWKVRNICADDKTGWVNGAGFTTMSSTFSTVIESDASTNIQAAISVLAMPNPNKGSFDLQMHLQSKPVASKLSMYNSIGQKIWQQDIGILSGSVSRHIELPDKLYNGEYVLIIEYGDKKLMQKIIVIK